MNLEERRAHRFEKIAKGLGACAYGKKADDEERKARRLSKVARELQACAYGKKPDDEAMPTPKKDEEDKSILLHEILDAALKINGGAVERCGEGHPTAFYNYSGHVNKICIRVYPLGWTSESQAYKTFEFDFNDSIGALQEELDALRKEVNG